MIRIAHGTWRAAIIVPALGIAVKVPKVRIRTIWKRYKDISSVKALVDEFREDVKYWEHPASVPMCVFGGWLMNLKEAWFSFSTGSNQVVLPTYASLFGLANLMPAGRPHEVTGSKLWNTALSVASWDELDSHAWSEAGNFVRDQTGRIRLVDYGDRRTQQTILRHREKFELAFKDL